MVLAAKTLRSIKEVKTLTQVSPDQYAKLYQVGSEARQWGAGAIVLQKWLAAFPENAESRKLELGKILLLALNKPAEARRILGTVRREHLTPEQQELFQNLILRLQAS